MNKRQLWHCNADPSTAGSCGDGPRGEQKIGEINLLPEAPMIPGAAQSRVEEFFRRFPYLLQRKLAIAGLRAHSKFSKTSPTVASLLLAWRCFQPVPTLEKEFPHELDDQRSPP